MPARSPPSSPGSEVGFAVKTRCEPRCTDRNGSMFQRSVPSQNCHNTDGTEYVPKWESVPFRVDWNNHWNGLKPLCAQQNCGLCSSVPITTIKLNKGCSSRYMVTIRTLRAYRGFLDHWNKWTATAPKKTWEATMKFYQWMLEMYLGKDTPRGDLAHDMKRDRSFPVTNDWKAIYRHLELRSACPQCKALFKRCWRDYEKAMECDAREIS